MLKRITQAWVYAHIQLSPEEAEEYKGTPVVYNGDVGFFFEPNEQVLPAPCCTTKHTNNPIGMELSRFVTSSLASLASRNVNPTAPLLLSTYLCLDRMPNIQQTRTLMHLRRLFAEPSPHFSHNSRIRNYSIAPCVGVQIPPTQHC